jgi:hypothetical protein
MSAEPTKTSEVKEYKLNVVNPFVPAGPYQQGLHTPLTKLLPLLNEKERQDLLYKKLMLEKDAVNQGQYIQAACELTVCSWFAHIASCTGERFEYEFVVEPPKDVDCAIWHKGCQFNIEVKCADYETQRRIVTDSDYVVHGLGRLDDYSPLVANLKGIFGASSEPSALSAAHHMDCKMKDYLIGAHEKFGHNLSPNELNVLFVCVDDQMDMTKWIGYLRGAQGLFTKDSFEPQENYSNVDVVVLTNLYHRHANVEAKDKISAHWDLNKAFNFALANPQSTKRQEIFSSFSSLLPLENSEFFQYLEQADIPEEHKHALGLSYFVSDQVAKGIYKFQGYPVSESSSS